MISCLWNSNETKDKSKNILNGADYIELFDIKYTFLENVSIED